MQLLVGRMMVMVPFSVLHARILTGDPLAAVKLAGLYVYSSREVCICSIHVLRPVIGKLYYKVYSYRFLAV